MSREPKIAAMERVESSFAFAGKMWNDPMIYQLIYIYIFIYFPIAAEGQLERMLTWLGDEEVDGRPDRGAFDV